MRQEPIFHAHNYTLTNNEIAVPVEARLQARCDSRHPRNVVFDSEILKTFLFHKIVGFAQSLLIVNDFFVSLKMVNLFRKIEIKLSSLGNCKKKNNRIYLFPSYHLKRMLRTKTIHLKKIKHIRF